jgi:hypothetical protein
LYGEVELDMESKEIEVKKMLFLADMRFLINHDSARKMQIEEF